MLTYRHHCINIPNIEHVRNGIHRAIVKNPDDPTGRAVLRRKG
jgi:hypothetical protein